MNPTLASRMDNLRAAVLLPQLARLDENIQRWNLRYRAIAETLAGVRGIVLPRRPQEEHFVGSSFQFRIPEISPDQAEAFVTANRELGVELKWFGAASPVAFTSNHHSWHYVETQLLPETDRILSGLFDMRLPLTFSIEDCRHLGSIIAHCAGELVLSA